MNFNVWVYMCTNRCMCSSTTVIRQTISFIKDGNCGLNSCWTSVINLRFLVRFSVQAKRTVSSCNGILACFCQVFMKVCLKYRELLLLPELVLETDDIIVSDLFYAPQQVWYCSVKEELYKKCYWIVWNSL